MLMASSKGRNRTGTRILVFAVIVVICLVLLLFRLFDLQVVNYDKYQEIVMNQLTRETNTTPERGKIYDTNGNLLVTNTTVYRVFISPYDIAGGEDVFSEIPEDEYDMQLSVMASTISQNENAVLIAKKCEELLGVDYETTMEKAKKITRRDETIMKNVDPDTAAELRQFISDNGLTNMLCLSADSKRYYCYGDLACHVLGFTNSEGDGVYGIESTYNDYLNGVSGKYITARDALGQDMPFKYESYVGAENGANLVITIDLRLQYELENQLKAAYDAALPSERVCGLAMDPNTGAILAMAVYPNYDCNSPYELAEEFLSELSTSEYEEGSEEYNSLKSSLIYKMWNNKVVSETYEPGSTFKVITASVGLEENVVTPEDHFFCSGSYKGEGFANAISCHKTQGHGEVTFARGLQQSCNPTLMQLIEKIGRSTFYKYFEAFGYTGRTGVDLPGEAYGIYLEESAMHATELAVYSFGQTFKCTPLQQLTAICAVANGGYLITPHVLKEMVDDDGNVIYSYESEEKLQIISEETCKTVSSILAEGVATDGGAKNAYVKGYSIAGKTGTSQKQDKWVYQYDEEGNIIPGSGERPYRIGSTMAYAPADDPQIAVLIMVDEPTGGNSYGSVVAAPYIAKFLEAALPYLGIDPVYTEEELASVDVGITNLVGLNYDDACLYLSNRKLSFKKVGKGNTVTAQSPAGGSRLLTESGVVYLYTDERQPEDNIEVPDLMGMTALAANRLVINSSLNIKIEGATNYANSTGAVVVAQSPAAGTMVTKGTIITVEFRHMDGTD